MASGDAFVNVAPRSYQLVCALRTDAGCADDSGLLRLGYARSVEKSDPRVST
jgi:hypothetical protein